MQSIGERLEEARKRKGISIREAAEATKIRGDYLHKFESNQFDIKLPEIYVRGFIRTYSNYLKIPADKIMSDYNALGLAEARSGRPLNREVYGRMDLSVSSAKAENDGKETTPPLEGVDSQPSTDTRNPATFVPKGPGGIQLDQGLIIKGIGLLACLIAIIAVLIYVFTGRGEKAAPAAIQSEITWVHPQPGERSLAIVAVDRVQVSVVQTNTGQTLFQGTLAKGERRDVPYRNELRINSDTPANLRVNIGGGDLELRDPKTNGFLPAAIIRPPR